MSNVPAQRTAVTLRAPRRALPGELINVDVTLADPLEALRGVQLHVATRGGSRGTLELVDIVVHADRPGYIFADSVPFSAYNRETRQFFAGLVEPEGTRTGPGAYVATYTYRVPQDARGTFVVEDPKVSSIPFGRPWGFPMQASLPFAIIANINFFLASPPFFGALGIIGNIGKRHGELLRRPRHIQPTAHFRASHRRGFTFQSFFGWPLLPSR